MYIYIYIHRDTYIIIVSIAQH